MKLNSNGHTKRCSCMDGVTLHSSRTGLTIMCKPSVLLKKPLKLSEETGSDVCQSVYLCLWTFSVCLQNY
jgi:hypothetical protein